MTWRDEPHRLPAIATGMIPLRCSVQDCRNPAAWVVLSTGRARHYCEKHKPIPQSQSLLARHRRWR